MSFYDTSDAGMPGSEKAQRSERWLRDIEKNCHAVLDEWEQETNTTPVRIAILDTGIDIDNPSFEGKTKTVLIECVDFRDGKRIKKSRGDDVGHGTHVAALLLRVAPKAQLYIARVCSTTKGIIQSDVANAIRHATREWEVNIITMSFGFERDDDGIKTAIREARLKRIVLFAAASNNGDGGARGVAFPARHDDVICVKAANSYNNRLLESSSADLKSGNLATLGEAVPSAWLHGERAKPQTGTSMATPILAGVAALILQLVRQLAKRPKIPDFIDPLIKDGYWERIEGYLLTENTRMVEVLQIQSSGDPCIFVRPAVMFENRHKVSSAIWHVFSHLMDTNASSQSSTAPSAIASRDLKKLDWAINYLRSELPQSPQGTIRRVQNAHSVQALRKCREIARWIDGHTQPSCLWLRGTKAALVGRSLEEICLRNNQIVVNCSCGRFRESSRDQDRVLRQITFSILLELLSSAAEGRSSLPPNFELDSSIISNNPLNATMTAQESIRELLQSFSPPITWVWQDFDILGSGVEHMTSHYIQCLKSLLAIMGVTSTPTDRSTRGCLIATRTKSEFLGAMRQEGVVKLVETDSYFYD